MKRILLLLLFIPAFSFAQTELDEQWEVDSLNLIIDSKSSHDTTVANAYVALSNILYVYNIDTVLHLCKQAQSIANQRLGNTSNQDEILVLKRIQAQALNNIGYVYNVQGDIEKALDYWHNALSIQEAINDQEGVANSLNNIAYIYKNQDELDKSLEYFMKSLKMQEQIENEAGVAICLNNIGLVYKNLGQLDTALVYYNNSLSLREKLGNKKGIATVLNNIGLVYKLQGKMNQALAFYEKSLKIEEELNNQSGIATSLNNMGSIYLTEGKYTLAKEHLEKALKIAQDIGYTTRIKTTSKHLYDIASKEGDFKTALKMYEQYITMRDSISNEENFKATIKQQAKYEIEKQAVADSIKAAEAEKLYLANLEAEEAKSEKQALEVASQKRQKWFLFIGLGLVALFGVFMYNRFKVTQKQKDVINKQHDELEETHKEISDSIKYAERLQQAILPSLNDLQTNLPNSFVLFEPKDVVSGDFYWMQTLNDTTFFAAADCTGHGVPGAMVSVVCSNALNRSVKEFQLTQPSEILNQTRSLLIETFSRNGKDVKDGMDIALCAIQGNKLFYSGANNPLWLISSTSLLSESQKEARSTVSQDEKSLVEFKATKQPVGLYANMQPFDQQEITTNSGDLIYLFTDGFADQFGGKKNKKLMYKPFKKLLLSIHQLPMEDQKIALSEFFAEWKGEGEQVDDVCIIGVRI